MNVHAIDKLVMRTESAKATIKAICKAYTSTDVRNKPYVADLIQGKGEGQIILLHGPPGTGKTLTAGSIHSQPLDILILTEALESVAEYTGRPLLTITAADLGHNPISLERNLLTFFRDANDWDAIVLLDEADVYLEKRGIQDLKRNSIVSGKPSTSAPPVEQIMASHLVRQSSFVHSTTFEEFSSSPPIAWVHSMKHSCLASMFRLDTTP